jgi:glycerol kinase
MDPGGDTYYALEGSVFVAGAAVQWLRDGLNLFSSAKEIQALAESVPDSGGVVFVPALTGLGAPHWDPKAKGAVFGITRGTTKAHLARATLESIAMQVKDLMDAMVTDTNVAPTALRVDGGAAANDLLLQIQADVLGLPIQRSRYLESTGVGAAFLAGLGHGIWGSRDELLELAQIERAFEPNQSNHVDFQAWKKAIELTQMWKG